MRGIISMVALIGLAGTGFSDEALPIKTLTSLKEATVFVKVEVGKITASGSGFVVGVDGTTAYVVTNHHVINPTFEVTVQDKLAPRPGFGPRRVLPPSSRSKTIEVTLKNTTVSLVFGSGTDKEQVARAEVVALDPEFDLAVLKVAGIKDLPKPIEMGQVPELVETMPVYVFGFPFGKALATNKGNPAITVGKGAVSSIRKNEKGEVALVQIDGALNPGNSGGPVVDVKGRLVGVAVATIKGTGIGLAIPPNELEQTMQGRVGQCRLQAKRDKGDCLVSIEADLVDPMSKLKSVAFHYVRTDAVKGDVPKAGLDGITGLRKIDLKIEGQKATGQFTLEVPDKGQVSITFQTRYHHGKEKSFLSEALAFLAKPEGGAEVASKPPAANPPPDKPADKPPAERPARPQVGKNENITKDNFDKVADGMTEEEVIKILGEPTRTFGTKPKRLIWQDPFAVITVEFRDGKSGRKTSVGLK